MRYENFISRRYLRSGRYFVSVSTWITILGVVLGVAVVCFVMSMHNGFESEIRSRLLGTTAHISIFPTSNGAIEEYNELADSLERIDGVVAASPFIYYKAAISSVSEGDGIIIRGIDLEREALASNVRSDVKVGEYSFEGRVEEGDTIPGIIIGSHLAGRLGIGLGDPVYLYSLKGEDLVKRTRPRVARFYLSGVLETGMYEFDANLAYISIEAAQKLFRTGKVATAVHLKLVDIYMADELSAKIDSALEFKYDVVPWHVLHKNLFSWIALEKLLLFLGFILIVLVAAFSIVSTLVMMTMEKRSEIGILKTIGSTPGSIARIFLQQGVAIGVLGLLGGWALALTAAYIQNKYQVVSLPPDLYFISYLPIETHLIDFLGVGVSTIAICLLVALYPAFQASRLSVVDVLRQ